MKNYKHPIHRYILCFSLLLLLSFILSACVAVTTPPAGLPVDAPEEQPFTFLFLSDTQADPQTGDYSGLADLLVQALSHESKPTLLLLGGDTVNDGADAKEWQAFWQAAKPSLDGVSVAAAAGNHDNQALLAEQFTWPDNAPAGPRQGFFYSFDMQGVHFIVLDSNIMGAANAEDIAWLEADLSSEAAQQATWRIAVCHHPFWPVAAIPKDAARAQTMREHFLPLLEEYGVDLLLVGHQHLYARTLPMHGDEPSASGLVQVMAASGGKDSYTPNEQPYLAKIADAPNYVLFTVSASKLTLFAYDEAGQIIDSYTLTKAGVAEK